LDLVRVADELYALPPEDFRAARDERAAQARASGDKALAREITALRRPVVSAWLVNLLARDEPGQMSELLALGDSLRDAQQTLDGDRLRELSAQRRDLVGAMVEGECHGPGLLKRWLRRQGDGESASSVIASRARRLACQNCSDKTAHFVQVSVGEPR